MTYGLAFEIFHGTEYSTGVYFLNTMCLLHHVCLVFISTYTASSVTRSAESTKVILSKIMNESEFLETNKSNFTYLMTQMQVRNLDIHNLFFKINWNTLIKVSHQK